MIEFRWARSSEIDLLVSIRLRDLKMFSKHIAEETTIRYIRDFFVCGLKMDTVRTLLAFDGERLVGTGTVYFYQAMPSNENPSGCVAQMTSVWVDESYRRQGIGMHIVRDLEKIAFERAGMVCLNSSQAGMALYEEMGFVRKENYFVRYKENL